MNKTDEFSFILKTASHGIGVFAVHDIDEGTELKFFRDDENGRQMKVSNVPAAFHGFCILRGEMMVCPDNFSAMSIGWYLNHSGTPNASTVDIHIYRAKRPITAGEEITIDYNVLDEPNAQKEAFYRSGESSKSVP